MTDDGTKLVSNLKVKNVLTRAKEGRKISEAEWKEIERALGGKQRKEDDRYWKNRNDMAEELGVSARRVRQMKSEGYPIPSRPPIDRLEFYKYMAERQRNRKTSDPDDIDTKIKQARLEQIQGKLQEEAAAIAIQTIDDAAAGLRDLLVARGPQALAKRVKKCRTERDTAKEIRDWITATMEAWKAGARK